MPVREAARKLQECHQAWKNSFLDPQSYPMKDVLGQIGGKWSILILLALSQRPHRFTELKRELQNISQRVLTKTLRDLEMDGLLDRIVYPTKPPSVEYRLTPLGESFLVPLWHLVNWSDYNYDNIQSARRAFLRKENIQPGQQAIDSLKVNGN